MSDINDNEAERLSKEIEEILKANEPDTWTVYDATTGKPLFTFDNHWFDEYIQEKANE